MYLPCSCLQESPERTDPIQNVMCASKEITLTHGSQTKVHRVGPFTGMNAVMFWGAIVAAVATAAAMVTPKWRTYRSYHEGLWRSCSEWGCVTMTYPDMQGEKRYKRCNEMMVCPAYG